MVRPNPLLEDFLAFSVIAYLSGRSAIPQFGIPGLLGTIARDATKYFLVIFTSHFIFTMTILFARVSLTARLELQPC